MTFQLQIAGRTLWQEARNEPLAGKVACSHTFYNRLKLGRWGHTLAAVCLSHMQYDGWRSVDPNFLPSCALADDDTDLLALIGIIVAAETQADPTGGATHYYNPDVVPEPEWVRGIPSEHIPPAVFAGRFGRQLFYKDVP